MRRAPNASADHAHLRNVRFVSNNLTHSCRHRDT